MIAKTTTQPDKATARPWQVDPNEELPPAVIDTTENGFGICEMSGLNTRAGIETAKANAALIVKAVNEHAAHEALAKYIEDKVLPMLEFCGYGGKNRHKEDSHIRQLKKRLEAIRGKAVQFPENKAGDVELLEAAGVPEKIGGAA